MSAAAPVIELLWWEGCPSTPDALADLRAALADAGLDPDAVTVREIVGDDQAARERFSGSPTIRIDGADVDPTGDVPSAALACRIYRLRDGRVSPVPDPADLRDALGAAVARRRRA
jgi:hypothetical protein